MSAPDPAISLADLKERLAAYIAAEAKILKGQEYTIKDRTLKRADLRTVKDEIRRLQTQINAIERGGIRSRRALPRDL